ncbi:hypothetical protein [Rhizobium sp. CF142]|uniref:hypothetical protein n=1 Tax=Rhizobium sp. CF142 TaxID=1144314 RepID=UPI00026F02D2|nr:hypothetical protein [Rhizobium sp. CF142]EJJ27312.1 hypothetical protein PMI11_04324 [Rhizobium sp. CF142]
MKNKKTRKGGTAMDGELKILRNDPPAVRPVSSVPAAPDLEKYRRHVAHFDLSEDQKTELMRTVWQIMQSFVDRAFGEDAAQLAARDVEKSDVGDETSDSAVIASEHGPTFQNHQDLPSVFAHHAAKRGGGRKDRS